MYRLTFLLAALILFSSCAEDDPVNPSFSPGESIYRTKSENQDSCRIYYIEKIDLNSGEATRLVDSARLFSQPENGKIIYLKTTYRESPDSGTVEDRYLWIADKDGRNPRMVFDRNFGQNICRAFLSPDASKAMLVYGANVSVLDISDGSERIIIQNNQPLDIDIVVFDDNSTNCAFVFDNVLATFDYGSNSLNAILACESRLESTLCFNSAGDKIFAVINDDNAGTDYLISVSVSTQVVDTLHSGLNYKNPCCSSDGTIIFADMKTLTTNNYLFDIWKIDQDGSDAEIISPREGNGYYHFYPKAFTTTGDVIAARVIPYGNGKCDNLVTINLKSKKVRQICQGCLED